MLDFRARLKISTIPKPQYSKDIETKKRELTRDARRFKHTDHGNLIYFSFVDIPKNLNGKAYSKRGDKIVCRHLAGYLGYIAPRGVKYCSRFFASKEAIEKIPFLQNNEYDKLKPQDTSSFHHIISIRRFGKALSEIAVHLCINEETTLFLHSDSHLMTITLRHKLISNSKSVLILKFFDPNKTNYYIRVMSPSLEALSTMEITDFLNDRMIDLYFSTRPDALLTSPVKCNSILPLIKSDFTSLCTKIHYALYSNLPHLLSEQLEELVNQDIHTMKEIIDGLSRRTIPGFHYAMEMGYDKVVGLFARTILKLPLSIEDKLKCFKAIRQKYKGTALCTALQCGNTKTVEVFLDAVLFSDLTLKHRMTLAYASDQYGFPGMLVALRFGHFLTAGQFLCCILGPRIMPKEKNNPGDAPPIEINPTL